MAMSLTVDYTELRSLGNRLVDEAERMRGELEALQTKANPDHCFTGTAASAYWERFNQWKTSTNSAIEALNAMGPMLTQVADAIEGQQTDMANQILNGAG